MANLWLHEVYGALCDKGKKLAEGDLHDINSGVRESWRTIDELTRLALEKLEQEANSLMHSLLYQEAKNQGISGILDGYRHIANNAHHISGK